MNTMAASIESDASAVKAPVVHWPTLPFYRASAAPQSQPTYPCVIQLTSGRSVPGELLKFKPGRESITLHLAQAGRMQSISFAYIRMIKLTEPVPLVPDEGALEAVGTTAQQLMQAKEFTVRLRDGTSLEGKTRGFVKEKDGLFLFLLESDGAQAIRCFIPTRHIEDVQIGPPLGETLVERSLLSPDTLAAALDKQSQLRQERIGTYLTEQAIITGDELTRALAEQQRRPNVRLGDLLVESKLITAQNLQAALAIQSEHRGRRLGDILIEMGAISARNIQRALSDKLGIPFVNVREFKVDPLTLELVDTGFAVRHQVLPLLRRGESLVVAVENPLAIDFAQDLRFTTGLSVLPVIADPVDLKARISKEYARLEARVADSAASQSRSYSSGREHDLTKAEDLAIQLSRETPLPQSGKARENDVRVSENTLVRLVNKMIVEAHAQGASDIHIECNTGNAHTRIRFRKDGDLEDYLDLPPAYRGSLVSRIKVMAELDISEHRHPQDGKIDFAKFGPLSIELRVAIIPTANNLEDVVLRILGGLEPVALPDMRFSRRDLSEVKKMINRSCGLFLVCGPTGSGKTTTLHSLLHDINRPDLKIWTAEDPIEITQPGLRQVQVQPKIDWTFAAAMRSFLRADPDVIMVGEMRDVETTKIGIEASLTGHLVFSTLHTNSAAESIVRLLDLGMDPFNFADALVGILSQRLARTLCQECKRSRVPNEEELAELAMEYCVGTGYDPHLVLHRWHKEHDQTGGIKVYEAVGCNACSDGYKGRVGVYELLSGTAELKHLVRTRAAVPQLVQQGLQDGMRLLRQDAMDKVLLGALDLHSARAVAS